MKNRNRWWAIGFLAAWTAGAAGAIVCSAQIPFFPGAEGYGGTFSGTAPAGGWLSNATVYHVTNLNDSGPGSLRNAFVENSSNKIIVFDVAGTINLTSDNLDIKNLSDYYIAGQTAPGPVTIYGDTVQLTHSSGKQNRNVVLRYLTFRKGTGPNQDSITFAGSGLGTNLILDHVSASWSEDEILSVANNNTNVTVQYSMIHDALVNNHAYGSLIRPRIDSNVTFHHNLYANNASRQARFGTYNAELLTSDFRNNVIYNWRDRASYAGGSSEAEQEFVDVNYVGNYLIAGPGTNGNPNIAFTVDKNVDVRAYQAGNFIDPDRQPNPGGQPNGVNTGWGMFTFGSGSDQSLTHMTTPFATPAVTTQTANDAYWQVLKHVGNFWWLRDDPTTPQNEQQPQHDPIDARVIRNVVNGTNPPNGIAANAPPTAELNGVLNAPMTTHPAGYDSDNDGMPDAWEIAHGLNPNSPAGSPDWKLDFDNDGYINLLEYINEVGEFPAGVPIVFNGATNNRYAVITNWRTDDGGITSGSNWQPSKYDEAQINSGTVTVDAVGQHAGLLILGASAGDNATLNVNSGWLKVADAVVIGGDDAASATLSLSGGELVAPILVKGAGGTFNFTGGTLTSGMVGFDLHNQGGTFSPGQSVGPAHVMGDLTLNSGLLQVEIASDSLSDVLIVSGDATLGGELSVITMPGFVPELGNSWQILSAGSIEGEFSAVTAGYSVQKQGDNLMLFFGEAPPLGPQGDVNSDGTVDAADYVLWKKLGSSTDVYEIWRENYGATGRAGSNSGSVPEPAVPAMLLLSIVMMSNVRLRIFGSFLQK